MSDNTVLLRLTTGEELVAKKLVNGNYAHVACLLPNGQGGIAIMPWMPYVKGTQEATGVSISQSVIVFEGEPVADLENEYKSNFGSGIITPPKQELII
jgi:hypothetical protein